MSSNDMTARPDSFDLLMADWLDRSAVPHAPEGLLAASLERTSRRRPLPAWRLLERWIPMTAIAMRRPVVPRPALLLALVGLVALALVAALILGVGGPKLPPPIGVAGNGQIVYLVNRQLYVANADGSSPVQLSTDDRRKMSPMFSNDGTMLAYRAGGASSPSGDDFAFSDLVVANADGSDPRVLVADVEGLSNPLWSPDGRFLAYTDVAGPTDHAHVIAVDGSTSTDLGDFGGTGAWTPSWSPDGNRLAVAVGDGSRWIIDRDGSNARKLSRGEYEEAGEHGQAAAWHPDGTRLLFTGGTPNGGSVFMISLDGSEERAIATHADGGVWSPDGSLIAYYEIVGEMGRLKLADGDGAFLRELPGTYGWYMPVFSPDGKAIAMRDDRDDNGVYVAARTIILDVATGAVLATIQGSAARECEACHPDWSATWQRVALP